MAMIRASNEARKIVSPRIATPRDSLPQQFLAAGSGVYEYAQICLPVAAFNAITSLGLWIVYIVPSTTSGVT